MTCAKFINEQKKLSGHGYMIKLCALCSFQATGFFLLP